MPVPACYSVWFLLLACLNAGCHVWRQAPAVSESLLSPAQARSDSTTLEIFFARFPLGQAAYNEPLWQFVDEQPFPSELRRRLVNNGFRVGLVGGQVPKALTELLKLTDQAKDMAHVEQSTLVGNEPTVRQRVLQLAAGQPGEIVASPVRDQWPLLFHTDGQLRGRSYAEAQGQFIIETTLATAGRVEIGLTPELHHGEPQQKWVGADGIFRLDMARHKRVFDALQMKVSLVAGQMLLVGCDPNNSGSLGYQFFTNGDDQGSGNEQKLLVIRVAQVPHTPLLADTPRRP